jgi:hypothetical protein
MSSPFTKGEGRSTELLWILYGGMVFVGRMHFRCYECTGGWASLCGQPHMCALVSLANRSFLPDRYPALLYVRMCVVS